MDLAEKSLECLNPNITACKIIARIVAKVVDEKGCSIQFIKNPLSSNYSSIDSNKTMGIMDKKRSQFPIKFPNLAGVFSDEVTAVNDIGKIFFYNLKYNH